MLVTQDTFADDLAPFQGARRLVVDTETTGLHPWLGTRICGVSLATTDLSHVCYFPIRHKRGENITRRQYRQLLQMLAETPTLTGWNLKFDLEFFFYDGLPTLEDGSEAEDVMLAAHHLNENDRPFELKRWASKHVDPHAADAEKELNETIRRYGKEFGFKVYKGKEKAHISELRPEDAEVYACDDVIYTEKLRRLMIPALKQWDTLRLWRESNAYMLDTMRMELRGFQLDVASIEQSIVEARQKAKQAYQTIVDAAGYEINLDSPKQLQQWLNVTSAAKPVLEQMDTPEAKAILTYRAWSGSISKYYLPMLKWRDEHDVLHPNLKLHGTVNGRQSAVDPNTHAMPKEEKVGYEGVKRALVARQGYVLISADYNQMELRMGVSVAQEENMAKIFLYQKPPEGKRHPDIHQAVADALKIDRHAGKTINFMILYGGGVDKLARTLGIPYQQAWDYLDAYHREYWHFRHTSRFWANRARYQGYIRMWSGRIRHFNHPLANPKDAFNSLVQGGSAEVLRTAIRRITPQLKPFDAHILLQIHDQIITECPDEHADEVAEIMRVEMEDFDQFLIRPIVDLKVGPRWSDLSDLETWRKVA